MHSQEAQEGGLDQQALHSLQVAWGAVQSHNTCDCCHLNEDSTPTKGHGDAGRASEGKEVHSHEFCTDYVHRAKMSILQVFVQK